MRVKRIVLNPHGKFCAKVEDRLLLVQFIKTEMMRNWSLLMFNAKVHMTSMLMIRMIGVISVKLASAWKGRGFGQSRSLSPSLTPE
jgi:hypothetical protein